MKVIRIPSYLAGLIAAVESGGLTTEQAAELAAATAHVARVDNPHGVTAAQVGAPSLALMAAQDDAVLAAAVGALDDHAAAADPHTGYRKEADNHPASLVTVLLVPTNYSTADNKVESHLEGINVALASAGGGGSAADWYWSNVDPISTDGIDGARWVNTTGLSVWIKASGTWTEQPGSLVWATGAPGPGDGADDDFCIDRTTGLTYGPKAGGAWPETIAGRLNVYPEFHAEDRTEQIRTTVSNADSRILSIAFTPPTTGIAYVEAEMAVFGTSSGDEARVAICRDRAAPFDGSSNPGGVFVGGHSALVQTAPIVLNREYHNYIFKMVNGQGGYAMRATMAKSPIPTVGGTEILLTFDLGGVAATAIRSCLALLHVTVPQK